MFVGDFRKASECEPMSQDFSGLFLAVTLKELESGPVVLDAKSAEKAGFAMQIMQKRLEVFSPETKVSRSAAIIAAGHSQGNPGRAVMWAYTFHRMYQDKGELVVVEDLANAFPYGFPTQKAFAELWDGQKSEGIRDNMLDMPETWDAV